MKAINPEESLRFSVLIPYYNEGLGVLPTIESLQKQSYRNWELICVDDGSTDNTVDILEQIASNDCRIKVIKKKNEGTPAKAINYGIQYLTGDFYFYSSKDDLFSIDFFESAYKVLANNDIDAVFPNLYYHYSSHDDAFFSTDNKLSLVVEGHTAAEMIAFGFKYPGNVIVRTSIVKNIGCYTFSFNSDEYTAIEYLNCCDKVGFCSSVFYYTQDDPNAFTKRLSKKRLTGLETNYRKLQLFEKSKNKDLVRYLKQYSGLYFTSHLYWYLTLVYQNIPCDINKQDFLYFYRQYRSTIICAPVDGLKILLLNCCSWNFNLLYFTVNAIIFIKYKLCQYLKTKHS